MVSEDTNRGIFQCLVDRETAVPCRRTGIFAVPAREGADVIVKICEARREVEVKKPVKKAQANGKMTPRSSNASDADDGEPTTGGDSKASKAEDRDDDDDDDNGSDMDSDSDDEPEEIRSKTWKVGTALAEMAIRNVKKGGKVEVTVNVGTDLGVSMTAREVGGKGGVRGALEKTTQSKENGSA